MSGYSSGLCDCFQDCGVCLTVAFCGWSLVPTACNWAGARQENCSLCHCCALAHPLWARASIKRRLGVPSSDYFADYCLYCFCFPCATCQDARELKRLESAPAAMSTPLNQANVVQQPMYQPPPPQGYVQTYG